MKLPKRSVGDDMILDSREESVDSASELRIGDAGCERRSDGSRIIHLKFPVKPKGLSKAVSIKPVERSQISFLAIPLMVILAEKKICS